LRTGGLHRIGGLVEVGAVARDQNDGGKSRARRIAVDRPMPWLAPVTMATECDVRSS
jgi:hypothetical protein